MNKNIRHLEPAATVKIIFAVILTFLALFMLFSGALYGLIFLGVSLKLAERKGFELTLEERKYRFLSSIFGVNFGIWKALPKIEYISVFKTLKRTRARVITAQALMDFEVFKVNLFYDKNKHIEAYISEEVEDSMNVAKHIATVLETDILDATKPEKEWINITSH